MAVGGCSGDYLIDFDKVPDKLFKVDNVGGTTILVRRKVLETIGWPYFKTTYCREGSGIKESSDRHFARRAIEEGFDIWADPTIQCSHYQCLDLLELFNAQ